MDLGMRNVRHGRARRRTFFLFNFTVKKSRFSLALLTCLVSDANFHRSTAQAQAPTIITTPTVWVAPAEETPLTISIESATQLPAQAVVVVRGMPLAARLSEGRPFGPGVWVVPLASLSRLRLLAPPEAGRTELSLALVTLSGALLAEKKVTLLTTLPPVRADIPTSSLAPARRPITDEDREFGIALLEMGNLSMKAGNLAVARQFYQRAAERGLAEAAMALAQSYDPRELARWNIMGVESDPAMARNWYEKARELGARDGIARLPPTQ